MSVTRADIVAAGRRWLDTPYAHEGRILGVAADCICVPLLAARELGLSDFDIRGYSRRPGAEDILALCRARPELQEVRVHQPGDLVVLAWREGAREVPAHFGLIGDYPIPGHCSLIHAWAQARKVCEHRIDDAWQRRIIARFAFRGAV